MDGKLKRLLKAGHTMLSMKAKHGLNQHRNAKTFLIEYLQRELTQLLDGAWAVGRDDIDVINQELKRFEQYQRISFLEVGGGASTIAIILKALQLNMKICIDTLEESATWTEMIMKIIRVCQERLSKEQLDFRIHPVEYCPGKGVKLQDKLDTLKNKYEIIFIDSPPDTSVNNGRLYVALEYFELLTERGVMIIHDTQRNMEMYAFKKLQDLFLDSQLISTQKGISVLRFPCKAVNT